MLCSNGKLPLPLMNDSNEDIALFPTHEEAVQAGVNNPMGKAKGYLVYHWPYLREEQK